MTEPVVAPEEQVVPEQDEKERGASLVEYALLVALIAIVCIVALRALGSQVSRQFSNVTAQIT
jgi:pilus assembly protein Flp/PilA